jgi:HAE1 family hydrophobic/amphiphilic exporter-1
VPLGAVADFKTVRTPASVERQQRRSILAVRGNMDGKQSGEVRKAVQKEMESMSFPPGYSWSFGSGFEEQDETQKELLINLLLALVLVYLVMAALFESLLHPFAIMLALPFAFVGISWMCLLTRSPFNLMAQIGLLILIGIVVNNGIVLVYSHPSAPRPRGGPRGRHPGGSPRSPAPDPDDHPHDRPGTPPPGVRTEQRRRRPVFPLARCVIGGLLASTVVTLLLVPCLYTLLEDGWTLVGRVWRGGPRAA